MITIKYNNQLLRAARIVNKSPEDVIHEVEQCIAFYQIADNDYAGEVLAMLLWDKGVSMKTFTGSLFPGEQKITRLMARRMMATFMMLTLYLVGSDNPCPDCGWEKAERSEDNTWFCPHCGWSEMMFLSEQNED